VAEAGWVSSKWWIIAVAVSVVLLVAAVGALTFFVLRRKRHSRDTMLEEGPNSQFKVNFLVSLTNSSFKIFLNSNQIYCNSYCNK